MGIKMSHAIYSRENRTITVNEVDDIIKRYLICKSPNCNAPLSYVSEHWRQYADSNVLINPYFRLKSARQTHSKNCEFNTEGNVEIIARDSPGILEQIQKQKFNFRLNVVKEAIKDAKEQSDLSPNVSTIKPNNDAKPSKVYENSGKLDAYLSSMNKIMVLRSRIEKESELANLISLSFNDMQIKWSNFYYPTENFSKIYGYLKKLGSHQHPICVEGLVKEQDQGVKIIAPTNDRFPFHKILLRSPKTDPNKDGIVLLPSIQLIIYNDKVLKYLKNLDTPLNNIAAYANFKINKSDKIYTTSNEIKIQYINITGGIYHKNQISLL